MNVVNELVNKQLAVEALARATLEWRTKCDLPFPDGFLKRRASDPERMPPSREKWLRQRTAEILRE